MPQSSADFHIGKTDVNIDFSDLDSILVLLGMVSAGACAALGVQAIGKKPHFTLRIEKINSPVRMTLSAVMPTAAEG